jgi:hypothetical protein
MSAAPVTEQQPPATVPQVQMSSPPVFGNASERKERPIEDVIHSIEPLIEDSVPRTVPSPLVPKQHSSPQHSEEPPAAEPAAQVSPGQGASPVQDIKWPVITPSADSQSPPETGNEPPAPPAPHYPVPQATTRMSGYLIPGVILVLILAIIGAVFVFANPLGSIHIGEITPVPTVTVTTVATIAPSYTTTPTLEATIVPAHTPVTPVPTPQTLIPPTGVWIRVIYPDKFTGFVGTPGNQADVADTGDKFYQIPTSVGIVVASIQKADGSSDLLTVDVYKDGNLVMQKSTVTPNGVVEVQADLKPALTPTPTPTPTKIPVPATTSGLSGTVNSSAITTP